MSFLSNLLPERFRKKDKNPVEDLKQNLPKEKANIKKSFATYCNSNHGTKDGKLCPKCNALLSIIFPKMNRCRYGVTKPVCDKCDIMCFGEEHNAAFMEIMEGSRKGMLVRHPVMTVRHKIMKMGVDYAKQKQNEAAAEKLASQRKAKKEKRERREKAKR